MTAAVESQHPLKQLARDVGDDIKSGNWFEPWNGSWAGHWPTPSEDARKVLEAQGNLMNLDASEFEIFLANAGKELQWSKMSEEELSDCRSRPMGKTDGKLCFGTAHHGTVQPHPAGNPGRSKAQSAHAQVRLDG